MSRGHLASLGLALLAGFVILAFSYEALAPWEAPLARLLGLAPPAAAGGPLLMLLNWWGTTPGAITCTAIAAALLLLLHRRLLPSLVLIAGLLAGWGVLEVLKELFSRPRPAGLHLIQAGGHSFPSGHAFITLLLVALFLHLAWPAITSQRGRLRRGLPFLLAGLLVAAVLATGWSRVLFGVHYLRDVAGGWLAGGAWTALVILLAERPSRRA